MTEWFTVYDEELHPVGTATRDDCHKKGLLHEVVHCWVFSRERERVWLYFQQRSHTKKDFPNYFDLTVGGHVDAGEDRMTAVLREMREEIGLSARPEELSYLGHTREDLKIGDFYDREVSRVFLYEHPNPEFHPGEEVDRMIKVPLEEFRRKEVERQREITAYTLNGIPFHVKEEEWCVHPGEFETLILPALCGRASN